MAAKIHGREISFGLWYDFRNPETSGRTDAAHYAQSLEHIQYAEKLGFDNIWTSEHHFIDDAYSPSLLPICAAIAAQTTRVRIGTNVLLLPLHDPIRIAEDAATVDVVSEGRFDLGVAVGYKLEEFEAFGISRRTRAGRIEEAVQVLRGSWSPEPFSLDGKYYQYKDVNVTPKPVQQPTPLWIGGFVDAAVRRAARIGDGLLAAANVVPTFLDEWKTEGREGTPAIALSLPWALIANDPEAAWQEIKGGVLHRMNNYAHWFTAAGMGLFREIPEDPEDVRRTNPDIVVTPERARELVDRIVESVSVTHLYWWAMPPGVAPKATYESMEVFSRIFLTGG